jgi:hypothetical protein
VLCASPVSEYVVEVEPVLETMVLHVEPPFVDWSISYPVTTTPLLAGAVQLRLISELETEVAVRFVGGFGVIGTIWAYACWLIDNDGCTKNEKMTMAYRHRYILFKQFLWTFIDYTHMHINYYNNNSYFSLRIKL